ncbi:hypothetical protein BUALT_Bualt15G0032800 [Buddleja alternifolia]|uniref:Uncharacterized protein n=1 Tax=Buddleja alternifolia TaxID=168488 RepID=A0AAV6WHJ4_9LAMI|nr:hypothetical protein BUALT_Bualt15G0032800 [Buddleja alternifolia]
MGISASKRVQRALNSSHEFNSACNSVYAEFLSLAQHAFAGVKPYQLFSATVHLHRTLSHSLPLISKWVPRCPDRVHVDRALKTVLSRRSEAAPPEEITLGESEFKEFALEVFRDAVVSNAGREVLKKVPLGVAGIAGVGVVVKPGKEVVAAAIGAYALAVATSIYLSLDV